MLWWIKMRMLTENEYNKEVQGEKVDYKELRVGDHVALEDGWYEVTQLSQAITFEKLPYRMRVHKEYFEKYRTLGPIFEELEVNDCIELEDEGGFKVLKIIDSIIELEQIELW